MTETRRHALKMLGSIGVSCAFPFAGDELYGQHVHVSLAQPQRAGPYTPTFFTASEYATVSRLADVIIPPTETPGASAAGVPEYIDRVVALNGEHQPLIRAGLAWLEAQAKRTYLRDFLGLDEPESVKILQPLSDELDRQQRESRRARFRTEGKTSTYYVALTDKIPPTPSAAASSPATHGDDPTLPVRMFRLVKNLTADGYYTSRVGLLMELGYTGNSALARYPECRIPEQ